MRLSLLLTLIVSLIFGVEARATGDSLYFLLPTDTVILHSDPASGNLLFDHYLAERQTLYGAARFYGLSLNDVYKLNPSLQKGYTPGSKVTVVVPRLAIQSGFRSDSIGWFVPIHYRMGEGETVFGLTRRTLGMRNDSILRALNPGLDPSQLRPRQVLKIGYLRIDGIDPARQPAIEDPYVLRNYDLRGQWATLTEGKRIRSTNGKAAWTTSGDRNKFMVLHRTAPIGSIVEIDDPRSRKTIYARVVGRIPEQVYDSRVIVVVSPLLVKAFGVRDREFYVRLRYL